MPKPNEPPYQKELAEPSAVQPVVKPSRNERDALLMEELVQRILNGEDRKAAIAATFRDGRKLSNVMASHPELRTAYDVAMICRADALAHEIIEISDSKDDPQRTKNRIDSRKWLASKLMPKRYGDRLELSIEGEISISAALAEARSRLRPQREAPIEDAEVVDQPTLPGPAPGDAPVWPDIFS